MRFDELDRDQEMFGRPRQGDLGEDVLPPPPPVPKGAVDMLAPSNVPTPAPPPDFGSFEIPAYSGSYAPSINVPRAPQFRPSRFRAPTMQDAEAEPGYQFRLGSGRGALESSAAARGLLRTGGTLKDLITYGQNFGAQEYNNVFNRALQAYGTQYQAERDMFAPEFAQWQSEADASKAASLAAFQRQYETYIANLNAQMRREEWIQNQSQPAGPPGDVSAY